MLLKRVFVKPEELALAGSQLSASADYLAYIWICFKEIFFKSLNVFASQMFLPAPDNIGWTPFNNLASNARRVTGSHLKKHQKYMVFFIFKQSLIIEILC